MENRVKELRLLNKKSQSEVAEIIGISQSQYAKYENGIHEWKLTNENWSKLANFFNVDVGYLMGITNDDEMITILTEDGIHLNKISGNVKDREKIALSMHQADEIIDFLEEQDHHDKNIRDKINALYLIVKELKK